MNVQMTVDVRRHLDVGVAKPFLDIFQTIAHAKKIAGTAVAKVVQPDVRETVALEKLRELSCNVIRGVRMAVRPAEHIIGLEITLAAYFPVPLLLGFKVQQELFYIRAERERAI